MGWYPNICFMSEQISKGCIMFKTPHPERNLWPHLFGLLAYAVCLKNSIWLRLLANLPNCIFLVPNFAFLFHRFYCWPNLNILGFFR